MTDEQRIFHRYLKDTGNRITARRDAVLKVLLEAKGQLTTEEITNDQMWRTHFEKRSPRYMT